MRALSFSWSASGSLGSTCGNHKPLSLHTLDVMPSSMYQQKQASGAAHYMKLPGVGSPGSSVELYMKLHG